MIPPSCDRGLRRCLGPITHRVCEAADGVEALAVAPVSFDALNGLRSSKGDLHSLRIIFLLNGMILFLRTKPNPGAGMRRILLTIFLLGLLGGLFGCDRFADEQELLDEQVVEERTPTEGTFVATVVGDKSVRIEGAASFRIPVISRNRLSLDFETEAGGSEGRWSTGVFLSTTWRRQAEEELPSTGYANLVLTQEDSHGTPTPWAVTAGSITLSEVTEERIEGIFRVSAQGAAVSHEADQVTIVGSFIALRHPL